jgi:hypothetical protein
VDQQQTAIGKQEMGGGASKANKITPESPSAGEDNYKQQIAQLQKQNAQLQQQLESSKQQNAQLHLLQCLAPSSIPPPTAAGDTQTFHAQIDVLKAQVRDLQAQLAAASAAAPDAGLLANDVSRACVEAGLTRRDHADKFNICMRTCVRAHYAHIRVRVMN